MATITLLPGVYTVRVDFNTNKVTVAQSAAKVIVGEAGYATYYKSNKAYVMPTGMNGYVFNLPGGLGEIAYAAGETVEAGRALVLEAAAGTYDLVFTDPVAPKDLASQLVYENLHLKTYNDSNNKYMIYILISRPISII